MAQKKVQKRKYPKERPDIKISKRKSKKIEPAKIGVRSVFKIYKI